MNKTAATFCLSLVTIFLITFSLPALAEKPSWAGNQGKSSQNKHNKKNTSHQQTESGLQVHISFNSEQRAAVHNYYQQEYRRGHCPPGLAKKNNGCMPPGQAKKWRVGHPLPSDVTYYDLPSALTIQLGVPPKGHRYIRVASDILLMAVGTGLIVDAIQDLSAM